MSSELLWGNFLHIGMYCISLIMKTGQPTGLDISLAYLKLITEKWKSCENNIYLQNVCIIYIHAPLSNDSIKSEFLCAVCKSQRSLTFHKQWYILVYDVGLSFTGFQIFHDKSTFSISQYKETINGLLDIRNWLKNFEGNKTIPEKLWNSLTFHDQKIL